MRTPALLAVSLALSWSAALPPATFAQSGPVRGDPRTAPAASYSVFYERLADDGEWREAAPYGYVWRPRVAANWRPYTVGHWARTDGGWTWISSERFGWATYHYGRWAHLRNTGWVWVPGEEWAPAWVSFRSNDRYIGWAPLPPEATFDSARGINAAVDVEFDLGPALYTFVTIEKFSAPAIQDVVLNADENVVIVEATTNVTNIRYANSYVFVEGPTFESVRGRVSTPFAQLQLERRTDFGRGTFETQVAGSVVIAMAAPFKRSATVRPARVGARLPRLESERGWSDVRDPQAAERIRAKLRTESPEAKNARPFPVNAAPVAKPTSAPVVGGPSKPGAPVVGVPTKPGPPVVGVPTQSSPPVVGEPKRAPGDVPPAPVVRPRTPPKSMPAAEPKASATPARVLPANPGPAVEKGREPALREKPAATKAPKPEMRATVEPRAEPKPAPTP